MRPVPSGMVLVVLVSPALLMKREAVRSARQPWTCVYFVDFLDFFGLNKKKPQVLETPGAWFNRC